MSEDEKIVFTGKTEHIYKIIVLGDPAVGKTSLLRAFTSKKFTKQYLPTVGVNILKEQIELEINGNEVQINLMLWDVAGQPQFYMLHRPYFNGADGMCLVFDVTRSSTFSNIKNWQSTTIKYGLSGIPRMLVGNKIDLKEERKIIRPMAQHLAEKLNASYFETSAKTGENVDKIFESIARTVFHSKTKK